MLMYIQKFHIYIPVILNKNTSILYKLNQKEYNT